MCAVERGFVFRPSAEQFALAEWAVGSVVLEESMYVLESNHATSIACAIIVQGELPKNQSTHMREDSVHDTFFIPIVARLLGEV